MLEVSSTVQQPQERQSAVATIAGACEVDCAIATRRCAQTQITDVTMSTNYATQQ
jgi:hypothetical protein